jgi:hypothetical protein
MPSRWRCWLDPKVTSVGPDERRMVAPGPEANAPEGAGDGRSHGRPPQDCFLLAASHSFQLRQPPAISSPVHRTPPRRRITGQVLRPNSRGMSAQARTSEAKRSGFSLADMAYSFIIWALPPASPPFWVISDAKACPLSGNGEISPGISFQAKYIGPKLARSDAT